MTTDSEYRLCAKAIKALLENEAHKATAYLSEKLTLVATRKLYDGKPSKRQVEISLIYGPPNYRNRKFIKMLKMSGTPFPVKRIEFQFPPRKKK